MIFIYLQLFNEFFKSNLFFVNKKNQNIEEEQKSEL